jgi:hypothetical protein
MHKLLFTIRILFLVAILTQIFPVSRYFASQPLAIDESEKHAPAAVSPATQENDNRLYVSRFLAETVPVLIRSLHRTKRLKKLETGQYALQNQKLIEQWYQLSCNSLKQAVADLVFLEQYSDTELQDYAEAKQRLSKIILSEIKLWREYDKYVEIRFVDKDKKRAEEISETLYSKLLSYDQAISSLLNYHKKKLEELQAL